jgi:Transcriptional regulators
MLTSRDIARKAGVSPSTVSRAFNPNSPISKKTREKILTISEQLGYSPNIIASRLKTKASGIIGVIFTESSNAFLNDVLRDLEFHLSSSGYRLIVMYSNDHPELEAKNLQTMLSLGVDGVFLMPVMPSGSSATGQLLKQYRVQDIPVLQCFSNIYSDLHTFSVNDMLGGQMATKSLLNLGHRNIIFANNKNNLISNSKIKGYIAAFDSYGLPCDENFILQLPACVDPRNVLKERIRALGATAVITSYEPLTISALKAFKELHYRYPEDISIISFDDNDWLALLDVTSVSVPSKGVGSRMASLLVNELMRTGYRAPLIFSEIDPVLINRNSVKNLLT